MKSHVNICRVIAAAFVAASVVSSCAMDELEPTLVPNGEPIPSLLAEFVDGQTRVSTTENGVATWDADDELTVFVAPAETKNVSSYRFAVVDAEKGVFSARDKQGNAAPADKPILMPEANSHDWYVMSPYDANLKNPFGTSGSEFSLDGQIQDANEVGLKHLTAYDVMTGIAKSVDAGQQPQIQLAHRVALIRFDLINESGKTLHPDQLTFELPQEVNVAGSYFLDYTNGLKPAVPSNSVSLRLQNFTLEANGKTSVYLVTAPFELKSGQEFTITVSSEEQVWKQVYKSKADRKFAAGKLNHAPVHIKNGIAPGQISFPDIWLKSADFKSLDYGVSEAAGTVSSNFSVSHQLKVFIEEPGKVMDWSSAAYRYETKGDDAAYGYFKPSIPLNLPGTYNYFVLSPFITGIVDPNGGNQSSFSLDGQVQDDSDPTGHISAYDIQTAILANLNMNTSKFNTPIPMEHKTAVLHLTIPNALKKDLQVASITVSAPGETDLGGTYAVDFASKNLTRKETRNNITLTFKNQKNIAADGEIEAYIVTPDIFLISDDVLKVVVKTTNGQVWENKLVLTDNLDIAPGSICHITFDKAQFVFETVWQKTAAELGINQNITGAAVNANYTAIQTYGNSAETHFILCNPLTGEIVKNAGSANTFMTKVRTDDAGHFVATRQNVYDAGCQVCYYNEATGKWTDDGHVNGLFWWEAGAGCPVGLGYGLDVCGDVTNGLAYVHTTGPGNHYPGDDALKIYRWGLSNSLQLNYPWKPDIIDLTYKLGNANSWTYSNIQRMSNAPDSDYYFSFYVDNSDPTKGGSKFYHIDKDFQTLTEMPVSNFLYKILDFQVVDFGGRRILFSYEQDHSDTSGDMLKIFDITGTNISKKPGDVDYDKVLLYTVDGIHNQEFVNYNVWGTVGTYLEETSDAYVITVVTAIAGQKPSQSNVRLFKMSWFK